MARVKGWESMRDWSAHLLETRTDAGLLDWNQRVRDTDIDNEPDLRVWLDGQGVTGYGQLLLVYERFGYPDFLSASAEELIDNQYADRPALRPIFDRLAAVAVDLGAVDVQARKTYVTLTTPRRKFAVVRATTRTRVDLGLRLDGQQPVGRLESAMWNDSMTVRLPLRTPDEIDDEVLDWLRRAYAASA
ncbi:MAG TPA: DUF5655 domain-containing protein [Pseudonocardiaceae bacterium]|jgi:hypothetical protein|nr:DUF5655 domain-containing protein [Pseudonocardiaceae bacterium]